MGRSLSQKVRCYEHTLCTCIFSGWHVSSREMSTRFIQFGCPFVDGDEVHPASNVEKMSRGIPLTNEVGMT